MAFQVDFRFNKILMKLGLISDVQYCDCDNHWNYEKSHERFYRNSINHLDNSLKYFRSKDCKNVLQLGDLIDGRCRAFKNFDNAFQLISKHFDNEDLEIFHVTGNHELYNFSRSELYNCFYGKSVRKYQNSNTDLNYYRVNLTEKISLIVLDDYEISVLNRRDSTQDNYGYLEAKTILTNNNTNESWNDPIGAKKAKYVAFNGAVGNDQLDWLTRQLTECNLSNNIVIIAGHIPLIGSCDNPLCLIWNDKQLLDIINKFPCVKAYICGHEHTPSIVKTEQFIQITMPGIIESLPEQRPYGILEIYDDKIVISDMPNYWPDLQFKFFN